MFKYLFRKTNSLSPELETKTTIPSSERLSDTDRKLRDQFYSEPEIDEDSLGGPTVKAPQMYKQLAAYGHEKGWIADPEKYPLMYPLLYNARDTAMAVYWRFQQRVSNDDADHTGALKMTLPWCVYVAMADAYFCHENWDNLRNAGLLNKLESVCGFDNIDDYIEKVFNITNEDELRNHILEIAQMTMEHWEKAGGVGRIFQANESMTAMFYYGIELGMEYLGLLDRSEKMMQHG